MMEEQDPKVIQREDGRQGSVRSTMPARETGWFGWWVGKKEPAWLRYGAAILSVVAAILIDAADFVTGGFRIYLVFYPFIVIATLFGGVGPGLLATALSCAAAAFYWAEPIGRLAIASRADRISMAIFIATNLFFIWICERLHRALQLAAQSEAHRVHALDMARHAQILKDSEQNLLLRERILNEAQEMTHVGGWQWDPHTDATAWSDELFQVFGRDPKMPPPRYDEFANLFPPESRAKLTEAVQKALETGASYELTLDFIHPDGTRKWITGLGKAIYDASGKVTQLIGAVQDITKSKQAEEALRDSEAKFRIVADNTYDWEFWVNPEGSFIYTSPSCLRITGHTAEEFQADPALFIRMIHPDDQASCVRHQDYVIGAKAAGKIEFRIILPDGAERWIAHACRPVFSGDGRYLGVRGNNRDITEHKRAEEALRESESFGVSVRDSLIEHLAVLDVDGTIIAVNRAWTRFAEENDAPELAERSVGMNYLKICDDAPHYPHGEEAAAAKSGILAVIHGEQTEFSLEYPCHGPTQQRWFQMHVSPLRGSQKGVVIAHIDTTKRKQAENALAQSKETAEAASQAKSQFIAVLSHELRTPLSPVLATVSLLEERPDLSVEIQGVMSMVHRNVELEAALIDDLLDITKINSGKITIHPEPLDAQACLEAALATSRDDIEAKHLRLSLSPPAPKHHVFADPTRLQQVFWNLLKNAVKFTPEGGEINIRSTNADSHLKIEISDTGIGIPLEVLPRIFNPFEQGEQTTTRFFGGLGLGLSIAKAVVELHHGSLSAFSAGKDKGSTFTLDLPTIPAPLQESLTHPASPDIPTERVLKILLVEDHPDTLAALTRLLTRSGYTVTTATNTRSALELVTTERFDLLISDLGLPDGSGLDLMQETKKLYDLHGIALSGYGTEEDVRRSRDAGFDQHLTKPVSLDVLRTSIKEVVSEIG